MAVSRPKKESVLATLRDRFSRAKAIVFTRNTGLTVAGVDKVRRTLQKEGMEYYVAKKTLISLAAKDLGVETIPAEILEGPVALTFGYEDEVSAPRMVKDLAKADKNLVPVGAIVSARVLSKDELVALANLPTRLELIGQLLSRFLAPVSGFARAVSDPARSFTRALKAVSEKK